MVIQTKPYVTVEDFDVFVQQPENADRDFEYVGGEIYEVAANNYSSEVGMLIGAKVTVFVLENKLGHVTGADGGYMVMGERYIPDVGFISHAKQPKPSRAAYNPNPPDLAVEVLSPSNTDTKLRIKIINYLAAGAVVWVFDPNMKAVEVYIAGQPVKILGPEDVLHGGDVLLGFKLTVGDVFPDEETAEADETAG